MRATLFVVVASVCTAAICATFWSTSALAIQDAGLWKYSRSARITTPSSNSDSNLLDGAWYSPMPVASLANGASRFTLALVVKSACDACVAAARRWVGLLDGQLRGSDVRLAIVSVGSFDLTSLDRLTRPPIILHVIDPDEFSVRTGVRTVPLALLLESGRVVRAAAGGVPSDRALEAFADVLLRGGNGSTFTEHGAPALSLSSTAEPTTKLQ